MRGQCAPENHEPAPAFGFKQRRQFPSGDKVRGEEIGADQQDRDPGSRQRRADFLPPACASLNPGIVPEVNLPTAIHGPEMYLDPLQPRRIGMAVRDEDVDPLLSGGHAPALRLVQYRPKIALGARRRKVMRWSTVRLVHTGAPPPSAPPLAPKHWAARHCDSASRLALAQQGVDRLERENVAVRAEAGDDAGGGIGHVGAMVGGSRR